MDHSKRERVMSQSFDIKCELTLAEKQAAIHIEVSGCEKVPLKLEVIVESGGRYIVSDAELMLTDGSYICQKCRESVYKYCDGRSLTIAGGQPSHSYAEKMRGTLLIERNGAIIAMTAYSPYTGDYELSFS